MRDRNFIISILNVMTKFTNKNTMIVSLGEKQTMCCLKEAHILNIRQRIKEKG